MLFLQAATNENSAAFKCFRLAEEGRVALLISPSILSEVQDVLQRPELRRHFTTLTPERSTQFVEKVLGFSLIQKEPPQSFKLPRDPDDEPYTDLAIAAGAQFLVTWNERHLTYLMKQDTP